MLQLSKDSRVRHGNDKGKSISGITDLSSQGAKQLSLSGVSRQSLSTFLLTALVITFSLSCKIVNFTDENVECSLSAQTKQFSGQEIDFYFSSMPDKNQAQESISLKENSKSVDLDYKWNGSTLSIKPSGGWQKGSTYTLSCNGTVTINTSKVSVCIIRTFLYGMQSENLQFERNNSILIPQETDSPLIFVFNKAIEQYSFIENFSLTPSEEKRISFSADGKTITVTPLNGWKYNNLYKWSFKEIKAEDSYIINLLEEGTFEPFKDTSLPELTLICPVRQIPENLRQAGSSEYEFLETIELDGNVGEKDPIGLIFSKPMNFDSVDRGFSITPSLSGYLKQMNSEGTMFAYFPTEEYQIKQKYMVTLENSISDTHDINLFEEKSFFFTPIGNYIEIQQITLDGIPINISTSSGTDNSNVPFSISKNSMDKYEVCTGIYFSTSIEMKKRQEAVSNISLSLVFPLSSESPVQTQIRWNANGTAVFITWENFTVESQNVQSFYKLQINGNKGGISNSRGEYMENDVCVILKPTA